MSTGEFHMTNSEIAEKEKAVPVQQERSSPPLTPRQLQVLLKVCEGKKTAVIAKELSITKNTVQFHLKAIYKSLKINSRTSLVRLAMQQRWIV
jgi:DNA-binding NarL/FixJ family response regulator